MCEVPVKLRELVKQILAAATEQIVDLVDRTISEYEAQRECFRENQEKSPEIDNKRSALSPHASVVPEAPGPVQTANDAARGFFGETPEPVQVQIINAVEALKQEQLQCSIGVSSIKEEQQGVTISSMLLFSAVDENTDRQAEVPTFSLDLLKQEKLITILQSSPEPLQSSPEAPQLSPEPLQSSPEAPQSSPEAPQLSPEPLQSSPEAPQSSPEPLQADFNENGQEEDECDNWEFEGLSGPESTREEQTENSSEEELLSPKKKPKVTDVSQNSNNVNSKPSHQTEAAERDGATVSYTASNEAVSSDGKTENSSDASENEDKSGKYSNQNCEENRGELPVNIIKLKDFKVVSNHMIQKLNFELDKGHKIAAASGNVGQKRKRKRRKKNTAKKAENDQSESDFRVKTSNHKCSECKATFDSLQKLKVHVNAHKRKKLSCSVCKKRFKAKHFLNQHMNVHKAQPATTAGKKNLDDTFNAKLTLASENHDDETDTDKTKDSSDEN